MLAILKRLLLAAGIILLVMGQLVMSGLLPLPAGGQERSSTVVSEGNSTFVTVQFKKTDGQPSIPQSCSLSIGYLGGAATERAMLWTTTCAAQPFTAETVTFEVPPQGSRIIDESAEGEWHVASYLWYYPDGTYSSGYQLFWVTNDPNIIVKKVAGSDVWAPFSL